MDEMRESIIDNDNELFQQLYLKNEEVIKKIEETIQKEDFESFKSLYQSYISDQSLYGYFQFDEQIPSSAYERTFYKLCTCPDCYKSENYFYKVHRHQYLLPCNCVNGKRYNILYIAYYKRFLKMGYTGLYFNYTIHDLIACCKEHTEIVDNETLDLEISNDSIIQYITSDGPIDLEYTEWTEV